MDVDELEDDDEDAAAQRMPPPGRRGRKSQAARGSQGAPASRGALPLCGPGVVPVANTSLAKGLFLWLTLH